MYKCNHLILGITFILSCSASGYALSKEAIIQKALSFTVKVSVRVLIGLSGDEKSSGEDPFYGTGCIIDAKRGFVMTSKHVITQSPSEIHVIFSNLERVTAERVYIDPQMDVAVIQFDPSKVDFKYSEAQFQTSKKIVPGHPVLSFGHPLGYEFSASQGIISSKKRERVGYGQFYQSDAIIGGGNSGGPLISLKTGKVLGLNTYRTTHAGTPMTFSLVVDDFLSVLKEIKAKGIIDQVKRGDIGASFSVVKDERLKWYFGKNKPPADLYSKGMFVVSSVRPGGPSDQAGLKPMDLLLNIGPIVATDRDIAAANRYIDDQTGKLVDIKVIRENKVLPLKVLVEDSSKWMVKKYVLVTGVAVHEVSPDTRGYEISDQQGVEVADILEEAPGVRGNIQRFDIIKMVGHQKIRNLADFLNALQAVKEGKKIEVLHQRFDKGNYGRYYVSGLEVIKPRLLSVEDPVPVN
jgi:serine protease Do